MLMQRYHEQSLRGGGSAFSSSNNFQGIPLNVQIEAQLHSTLLNRWLVNLSKRLEEIEHVKEIMSTEEGKSVLCRSIAWILDLEQLFCYFQFQIDLVKRHKQIIEKTFQYFLELASTIIQWDRLIALKILKICNSFSRLIFIYYSHSNERSQQQQKDKWSQLTSSIINLINLDCEASLFYNCLIYELTLIQACIGYIPTEDDPDERNTSTFDILKEIFNSAVSLIPSPDLVSSISKGALFLYQQYQKKKSMEQFQNCLFLEQLKWNILMSIKAGVIFNEIEERISNNFNKIIKNGSDWAIQYSWIKMASELMACKPQISKIKFMSLQQDSTQIITWEQAQSDNLIHIIHKDFEIAEIIAQGQTSNIGIKLQSISRQYQNLQNFFMNGNQIIPKFISYYTLESGKDVLKFDNESYHDYFQMIQSLRQIPLEKIAFNFNEFLIKFQSFLISYYQIEPKNINLKDFEYQLILAQENYQSLLNDINKLQISRDCLNNIIQIISPLLIKSDELIKQQASIYQNCFQTFLYNYSKIQSKKFFDNKRDIYDQLIIWLQQINLCQEQQIHYQKQFGKKMPDDYFNLSKIQEKPFQIQLNYLLFAIQFCQQWNHQIQLLTSLFTKEHIMIKQQIIIAKSTQEAEIKKGNLIEEFISRQNTNFEYLHSTYSILQMLYEYFYELKTLLFDKLSLEEFDKIVKKQKKELVLNLKFDFNLYFQYQINQHQQFIQKLDTENEILSNQINQYQNNKNGQMLNYFCQVFNISLITINQILNFDFDSVKKMEMLIDLVNKKDNQVYQNVRSNSLVLQTQIDLLVKSKEKVEQSNNVEYVEKVKDFENSVKTIQQELLFINNSDCTSLVNELNKFNEFLVHARTRQKHQLDSTINALKKCTLDFIDKIVNLYKNVKQSLKKEIITEMCESIDERKPIKANLQELTNNFKDQIMQAQQSIEFSEIDTLQNLVDLMKFSDQNAIICHQCEDQISKLLQKFQLLIKNLKSLNYESFCKSYADKLYFICQNQKELDRFLKDQLNFIFSPFQNQVPNNLKQCKQSIAASILNYIEGNQWRVKEGFVFQCIQLENQLHEQNKQSIQKVLILIAVKETNLKILVTLKNKQIVQQMYQGFSQNWPELQSQIQQDLVNQINKLEELQYNISGAETDRKRELLLQEHKQLEEQLEQQILNVNQIGDALGITITFLREIRQDLKKIQQKLDKLLNKIDEIVQDLKQLIGKTPKQLLEIRMQSILQQKVINDFNNVYVILRNKELKENFKDEDDETTLFNDIYQTQGEIDEFLQQPKDSLLIHGPAGSGKSAAAKKIEEYLWLKYQQLNLDEWSKDLEQIPVVPIFIQLASLKDPYEKAVEETLSSNIYNFDWKQIQAFQAQVEEGKVAVIFILDSFDELSNNQINLIQHNKLKNWKQQLLNLSELTQSQQRIYNLNYPKIITTTRSEAFELNSTNYRQWFSSEAVLDFTKYKELRILSFDDKQKQEYLKQYSYTQIKKTLFDFFEKYSLFQKRGRNLISEVEKIWNIIEEKLERFNHQEQSNNICLSDKEINIIISVLQTEFQLQNKQDQFSNLERQLMHIQTPQFYNNNIIDFNLEQLLKTPFMMKIFIDVLPQINCQKQEIHQEYFITSYKLQMYEKYVKKQDIKAIRNFLEGISQKQWNEDYQDEQNNQQHIPQQPEGLEQIGEPKYQPEIPEDPPKLSSEDSPGYPHQDSFQIPETPVTPVTPETPETPVTPETPYILGIQKMLEIPEQPEINEFSQSDKEINEPSQLQMERRLQQIKKLSTKQKMNQSQPVQKKLFFQKLFGHEDSNKQNQNQNEQAKSSKSQNDNTRQSDEKNYYREPDDKCQNNHEQMRQSRPINIRSQYREEKYYQKSKQSTNYEQFQEFIPQTIHPPASQAISQQSYDTSAPSKKSYNDQPHIPYLNQTQINLKLEEERLNLQTQIKEHLTEQGKKIFQNISQISQQDQDQLGDDKQILLRCYKSFKLTQYDFYQYFLENYIQNQIKKLLTIQHQNFNHNFISEVIEYARLLAQYLMKHQLTTIDTQKVCNQQRVFKDKKIIQHSDDPIYQELINYNSEEIAIIIKCLPLKLTGNILSFQHKSIQEFIYAKFIITNLLAISSIINQYKQLQAKISLQNFKINMNSQKLKKNQFILICIQIYLFNNLDQTSNKDRARDIFIDQFYRMFRHQYQESQNIYQSTYDLLSSIDISPLNSVIMANQFYMGTIRFIKEYIENKQDLKSVLHFLVLISQISSKFINISSNSIQLLTYMQELFYEKSFFGIQIKDVKLLGFKCIGCDFTKSKLENVTLVGTNLNYCKIAEVEWKNIISQDLPTLSFNIGPIIKASFSFDGQYIASLGLQQNLVIYQISTGLILKNIQLKKAVQDFCWSNTKSTLVYFYEETLNILSFYEDQKQNDVNMVQSNEIEVNQQHIKFKFKINDTVVLIKFSNSDSYLLVGCQKGKIIIYKFLNQQFTLFSEIQRKSRITFDLYSDENSLIACDQNQIFLVKIQEGHSKTIRTLTQDYQVTRIVFSSDGKLFAYATTDGVIIVYSLITQKDKAKLIGHKNAVRCVCFSSEGNILVSGGDDKSIRIWDYMKGIQIGENLHGHFDVINSIEFSKPDGTIILSAGNDGLIKQWNHSDNYHVSEYLPGHEGSILFMVLSQDSHRIITKGKDKKIIQWNIETASVVNQMISLQSCQECSINKLCSSCQLSPIIIVNDDQHIITGGFGHSISIFDIYTGNQTNFTISYLKPKGEVIILTQSEKYHLICSGTMNGEIKIWDSFNGRQFSNKITLNYQILTFFFDLEQNLIVLNQCGKYTKFSLDLSGTIAQACQCELICEASEMKQINQIIAEEIAEIQIDLQKQNFQEKFNKRVACLALTFDYSYLAIATKDSNVYILETADLSEIFQKYSYQGVITSMYFNKNGLVLILSFEDLSIKVWDISKKIHGSKICCHQAQITCLGLSKDNQVIVSTSQDKQIKIWKMENMVEDNFFDDINRLKQNLNHQKKYIQETFDKLDFSSFNKNCISLQHEANNINDIEQARLQQETIFQRAEENYHNLSELRRVEMSATLRAQKTLKDEITKAGEEIKQLLKESDQQIQTINQRMIEKARCCFMAADQLSEIFTKKLRELQELKQTLTDEYETRIEEKQQNSEFKVNSQNQITITEIFCLSKTPQNSKFIGTIFTNSYIKNKTNHNLFKLWQQSQENCDKH